MPYYFIKSRYNYRKTQLGQPTSATKEQKIREFTSIQPPPLGPISDWLDLWEKWYGVHARLVFINYNLVFFTRLIPLYTCNLDHETQNTLVIPYKLVRNFDYLFY